MCVQADLLARTQMQFTVVTEFIVSRLRALIAMPTLLLCTVMCTALVVTVGLQQPAVSVGVRWERLSRTRPLAPIPVEGAEPFDLTIDGQAESRWWQWIPRALGTLLTLVAIWWILQWLRGNRTVTSTGLMMRPGTDVRTSALVNARAVESGLVAAISILATERDAGNAVVKAWQGLEDAAAEAGLHRAPAETASEFTARILYRSRRSSAPIAELQSLYQRVRFGEQVPTTAEIAAAKDALTVLAELWRSDPTMHARPRGSR